MTFLITLDVAALHSKCGNSANSFDWGIRLDNKNSVIPDPVVYGAFNYRINSNLSVFNDDLSTTVSLNNFINSIPIAPSNGHDLYISIYCPGGINLFDKIADSAPVNIKFGSAQKIWACIAGNNNFACSPANLRDCSDTSACAGRPCIQIGDSLCGQSAVDASCGTGAGGIGPGQPGEDQLITWGIFNPLIGMSKTQNVFDLIVIIADWILNIAGSLIILLIIYSGVRFLISRGNPGEIQKAKSILFWALVGFGVILIGKGFIYLIESVLQGKIPIFP